MNTQAQFQDCLNSVQIGLSENSEVFLYDTRNAVLLCYRGRLQISLNPQYLMENSMHENKNFFLIKVKKNNEYSTSVIRHECVAIYDSASDFSTRKIHSTRDFLLEYFGNFPRYKKHFLHILGSQFNYLINSRLQTKTFDTQTPCI